MALDLVQNFSVEVATKELLRKYLEVVLSTALDSTSEIAVKFVNHDDEYKELYYPFAVHNENSSLPVLLIGGWFKSDMNKENSYFNGYKPWTLFNSETALEDAINYIMNYLVDSQDVLSKRFFKECGDGYSDEFNYYDGSIGVGYKLISNGVFPNSLTLFLTHIYYGK